MPKLKKIKWDISGDFSDQKLHFGSVCKWGKTRTCLINSVGCKVAFYPQWEHHKPTWVSLVGYQWTSEGHFSFSEIGFKNNHRETICFLQRLEGRRREQTKRIYGLCKNKVASSSSFLRPKTTFKYGWEEPLKIDDSDIKYWASSSQELFQKSIFLQTCSRYFRKSI